jgi:hypothetical protein
MNLDDIEEMAERDREDTYLADYDIAFEARMEEQPSEFYATSAWRRGWQQADESLSQEQTNAGRA